MKKIYFSAAPPLILFFVLLFINPLCPGCLAYSLVRVLIIIFNIVSITLSLKFIITQFSQHKTTYLTANLFLTLYMLVLMFLLSEGIFMFVPKSHGVGYTLSAQIWSNHYWNPINSFGYRDKQYSDESLKGRKKIFVIGDSLVAGHGIDTRNNRFSDILQKKLSDTSVVFNMGKNGSDTRDEYKRLVQFPYKPDVLILAYFANDIEGAAEAAGAGINYSVFAPYNHLDPVTRFFITHSYVLNYVYWEFPGDTSWYVPLLKKLYAQENILALHKKDLLHFVDYARVQSVPMVVIVFPFLPDLRGSAFFIDFAKEFFSHYHVPVLSVADLINHEPPEKLVVNNNDAHPNEFVNRIIADALYKTLVEEGYLRF